MHLFAKSLVIIGVLSIGGYGTYRASDIYGLIGNEKRTTISGRSQNHENNNAKEDISKPLITQEDLSSVEIRSSSTAESEHSQASLSPIDIEPKQESEPKASEVNSNPSLTADQSHKQLKTEDVNSTNLSQIGSGDIKSTEKQEKTDTDLEGFENDLTSSKLSGESDISQPSSDVTQQN